MQLVGPEGLKNKHGSIVANYLLTMLTYIVWPKKVKLKMQKEEIPFKH